MDDTQYKLLSDQIGGMQIAQTQAFHGIREEIGKVHSRVTETEKQVERNMGDVKRLFLENRHQSREMMSDHLNTYDHKKRRHSNGNGDHPPVRLWIAVCGALAAAAGLLTAVVKLGAFG